MFNFEIWRTHNILCRIQWGKKICIQYSILCFLLLAPFINTDIGEFKLHNYDSFHRGNELYPHEILLKRGIGQGKVFIAHEIGNIGDFEIGKDHDNGVLGHSIGGHEHGFGGHRDFVIHDVFGEGGKVITVPVVKNVPVVKHVPVVKKVPVVKTVEVVRHVPVLKNVPVVQHVTLVANGGGGGGLGHGLGKGRLGNFHFGGGHGLGKGEYEAGYSFGGGHHDGW